jgi:hypothetical protein
LKNEGETNNANEGESVWKNLERCFVVILELTTYYNEHMLYSISINKRKNKEGKNGKESKGFSISFPTFKP